MISGGKSKINLGPLIIKRELLRIYEEEGFGV
jgi:hypothetical protein